MWKRQCRLWCCAVGVNRGGYAGPEAAVDDALAWLDSGRSAVF